MKRALLVGAVVSSLALAACGGGSSPSAKKASFKTSISSLGGSPNLQISAMASFTGAHSTKVESILKHLSFQIELSNPSGGALSQSNGSANLDFTTKVDGTTFLDLRLVNSNVYFKADITALAKLSTVKLPAQELAALELVLGGRWFELPKTLLNSLVPKKDASKAKEVEDTSIEYKIVDDITGAIDAGNYKSLGNGGYSETGTLLSIDEAVLPTIDSVKHVKAPTGESSKGSYSITVVGSGSTATGATISITAPYEPYGNATGALTATFAHANTAVSAPSGATLITDSLLHELGV